MLFFQLVLLGGYAYAHVITHRIQSRWQAIVHLALDLSGAKQMAVTVEQAPGAPQPTTTPVFVAPISSV